MESANIHRKHSLQDQLVGSSTLDYSPTFAAGSAAHGWTPNTILNTGIFSSNGNAVFLNSRNPRLQNDILVSSPSGSMTQDLGFDDWSSGLANFTDQSSNDIEFLRIKRELSDSYPKSEMIGSLSSGIEGMQTQQPTTCYTTKDDIDIDDINVKLLLKTVSPGGQSSGLQSRPEEFYYTSSNSSGAATHNRGTFGHIYPTVNVSNFNQTSMRNSSAFDMNLQALDLFQSAIFSGSFRQSLQDQLDHSKNGLSYGLDYMKQSIQRPLVSSNITSFRNGVEERKRSDIILERKAPQVASKRSRLEPRASCPPFKVRKEKLGDRIAALQQLVAPFGKTDTASVLMEAIGYIKFLQSQVETLSVPYLKSSHNKTKRAAMKGGPGEKEIEERKQDLKSRGLCLVPLSCLSYVADDGGSSIWPPHNFG